MLRVEINFANVVTGFSVRANNCVMRGLVINRSSNSGIVIGNFANSAVGAGSVIEGCFIGTNAAGTAAGPGNAGGIRVVANDVLIGGTSAAARNLISGNGSGIFIGSTFQGVTPTNVRVQGNLIGTNAAGTAAITAGVGVGVAISELGGNHIIGGTTPAARNIISGQNRGVIIDGITFNGPLGNNRIQGNFIGLNVAGNAAIPNGVGVLVSGLAMNNIIGGTAPGEGNVISGNREDNVLLGSTGNRVQGNRIGTNAAGTAAPTDLAAGTFASGVNVAVSNNTVGGSVGGAGNIIAFNTAYGIFVSDINIQNNSILGNSISPMDK